MIFTKFLLPLMGSSIRFLTTPIQEKLGKHYMLQPQTSYRCIVTIKTTYKYSIFLHMHQAVILLEISAYFPPIWIWTLHLCFYISWSHVSTQGVSPATLTQWKIIVPVTEPLFWKFSTQSSSSYPTWKDHCSDPEIMWKRKKVTSQLIKIPCSSLLYFLFIRFF